MTPFAYRAMALILLPCLLQEPITAARNPKYRINFDSLAQSAVEGQALATPVVGIARGRPWIRIYERILGQFCRLSEEDYRTWANKGLALSASLSVFASIASVNYVWREWTLVNPIREQLSFMSLAAASAASGSLYAQWLKISSKMSHALDWRTFLNRFDWLSFLFLIGLGMTWSAWVEAPIYQGIEQMHFSSWHFLNALAQTGFREKLVGFYWYYEWRWAVWILLAMLTAANRLISFICFQAGVFTWNVSFESEDYPDSEAVIAQVKQSRWFWWAAPGLQGIQWFLNLRWYIDYLWNAIAVAIIASAAAFLWRVPATKDFVPLFIVTMSLLWIIRGVRRLSRILTWGTPFIAAPLLATGSNSQPKDHGFSCALLVSIATMAVAMASGRRTKDDWLPQLKVRIQDLARYWHERGFVKDPSNITSRVLDEANAIKKKLRKAKRAGDELDKHQVRRDSLIALGEFNDALRSSSKRGGLWLLPWIDESREAKGPESVQQYVLMRRPRGDFIVHVSIRPDRPRMVLTFWLAQAKSKRDASLHQYRFGYDKDNPDPHIDERRSDKRGSYFLHHDELKKYSDAEDRANGKNWVLEIQQMIARLPHYRGKFISHPAFEFRKIKQAA